MDPERLKVVDLRKELQQRGLDTKGNKAVLVKRLKDALEAEAAPPSIPETTAPEEQAPPEDVKVSPVVDSVPEPIPTQDAPTATETIADESITKPPVVEQPNIDKVDESQPVDEEMDESQQAEVVDEDAARGQKRKLEEDDAEHEEKKLREDEPQQEQNVLEDKPQQEQNVLEDEPQQEQTPIPKERPPPAENEPEIDNEKPQLSWYDSDLHLKIDPTSFLSAKPNNEGCFGYIWAGARATYGISSGKMCFEVKVTEQLQWEDLADKMQERERNKYRLDHRKDEENEKDEGETKQGEETNQQEETKVEETEGVAATVEEPEQNGHKIDGEAQPADADNSEPIPTTEEPVPEPIEEQTNVDESTEQIDDKSDLPPIPTHYIRIGFSMLNTTLQLGEAPHSYGYESTGKFIQNKQFQDYAIQFGVGDVVGAFLSIDDTEVTIKYSVNGVAQPTAISVPRGEFPEDFALFPHVLCRNYAYELNFGNREEPWFPIPEEIGGEYQFLQAIDGKVSGPNRPETREDCEVILMVGLPGSGKTYWVNNHVTDNPDKYYTVIGNHPLFDRMTVDGESMKSRFKGSWKILVDRMQKCVNHLTDQAALRRRNYIIDQTNVFPSAQRRKLRSFAGFKRKAVIVVCEDEELQRRQKDQHSDYGKSVPDSTMYDLKAQMELPQKCDWIEELIFTDLDEEAARAKVKEYNEDANKNGYFKRWQNDKKNQHRNYRPGQGGRRSGGFRGQRFDRYPQQGGWHRQGPNWGGRRDVRPYNRQGQGGWRQSPRDKPRERNSGGYGGNRQQGARPWQNNSGGWGGQNQRAYNPTGYGAGSYGGWNQNWKYGGGPGGYGSQRNYGYGSGQNYGGYGSGGQSYGPQGGYGGNQANPSWNYYGQYGQQQGYNNQQKRQ